MSSYINTVVGEIYLGNQVLRKTGFLGSLAEDIPNLKQGISEGIIVGSADKNEEHIIEDAFKDHDIEELATTLPMPMYKFIATLDSNNDIIFGAGFFNLTEGKTPNLYKLSEDIIYTLITYLNAGNEGMGLMHSSSNIIDILIGSLD